MKNEKEKTERKEKKTIGKKASGKGRDSLGCGAVRSRFSQHRIFSAQCWLSSFHANTIKIGTTRRKRDWPKIRSFHQCLATKQRREGEKKKETDEKANRVCTQNAALRSKATMSKDCFCLKTAKKKKATKAATLWKQLPYSIWKNNKKGNTIFESSCNGHTVWEVTKRNINVFSYMIIRRFFSRRGSSNRSLNFYNFQTSHSA